ncbi:GNAT family N-acetyltransferase [uncultured Kordia sp.]|uniref:GNAT family N-acetyltransferase n=1 Tax=uncultured Kordia sp. TaxID=507699 RepID=UPI002602981E|nr:GNAT family N-acetyltransferase [uncultured Kordia sp.]
MAYTIVPLSSENIKDLTFLYKRVFGNKMTLEMVKTKFDTSYLEMSHFGHLAYDGTLPIAFHGAIPVLMKYKETKILAAQYGDAMTLPDYTGKGLFTKLGKHTDEQLKKANISFVWGFPNQNSEYGYLNKLDWIYKERMQRFNIKTGTLPIEKIAKKSALTHRIYDSHILNVFKKYKTQKIIKGSVYTNNEVVSTVRDEAYYAYKSFTGNFTIELDDVLFWIKIKNGLMIGDIETPSEEKFHIAFEKLKKIAQNNGIGEINIQASPNTLIYNLMQRYQTPLDSWVVGFKNFNSDFPLEHLKLTLGDLDTF